MSTATPASASISTSTPAPAPSKDSTTESKEEKSTPSEQKISTPSPEEDPNMTRIYVTNLNFETTDEQLEKWVREKLDNKSKVSSNIVTFKRGNTLRSRGYAFICVENAYKDAAIGLDGQVLMDRPLTIKLANTRRTDEEKAAVREEREKKRQEAVSKRAAATPVTPAQPTAPKQRTKSKRPSKPTPVEPTPTTPPTTDVRIRMNNVNYDATQQQLDEFVEKALGGKPVACNIVAYSRAGESRSRGYAHLTVTSSQLEAALAMNGQHFLERELHVKRSDERKQQQQQTITPTPAPTRQPKGKKTSESKQPTTTPAPTKPKKTPEQKQPQERKRRERPEVTDFKAENAEIGIHSDFALIDIGANLIDRRYRDFDTVIQRAHTAGVTKIILTGTNIDTTKAAIELVKKHPGQIYTTVGIHPHNAKKCTDELLTEIENIAKSGHIVAIGECGLDFNRDYSPRDVQLKVFEQQVALAVKLKLPLFLHEREAHKELMDILSKHKDLPPVVIHCFTGSQAELEDYVKAGFSIGLTGFIAMKGRGEEIRKYLKTIPLKQLMIETDSPYMSPNGDPRVKRFRNRNEPVTLPIVVETIHQHTSFSIKEVAEATTANAIAFFKLS